MIFHCTYHAFRHLGLPKIEKKTLRKVSENVRKNTWEKDAKNNQKRPILDLKRDPFGDRKWYLFVSWPALGSLGASPGAQRRDREAQGTENDPTLNLE